MHRVDYLTARQERIVQCVRQWIAEHGEAPTLTEIGETVGLHSKSAVLYQLRQIEAKGSIVREPWRHRGIRLT
ncbi:LexA family transcriptional regulator [Streptomyces sp. NBC_00687]|uniref:LexA family protein n=1 Tax=Streptomyces sp. NBC_00687 TaxID=2975807 RepID=UPI002254CD90|nr:hypothetical protein [Streptomyces sp. NBC_00687]MCX4912787.1 hypothetical protein [Streptomyces sp. NBC_00687]